ncbi:MAG TPA: Gfo/Idh/MocA family oxidoreductase [Armatimonadota bacterium]|nr:Gfo/Idh/MocA family oxidoreductase [Armatimonadota bacterium]
MKAFTPVKTALIGSGAISGIYLENCCKHFNILDVVGCSDIKPERAKARAEQYGIRTMTNEEILSDPSIELVINTTYPTAHYKVSKAALQAGKHVYSEKMIAVTLEQARELVDLSHQTGKYLCAAPDTFLGAGLQTARGLLDSGIIGRPMAADFILVRGYRHSEFHTDPEKRFVFFPGGGILFDVGCYYLTALVSMLGPISQVAGFDQTDTPERPFRNPVNPNYGQIMTIESPNQFAGALQFENGVLCSLLTSSEGINVTNHFTIYGSTGTLTLNDPNTFGGPIYVQTKGSPNAMEMPLTHAWTDNMRGLGIADLAYAIRNERQPRCHMDMAFHTYEAAIGVSISCQTGSTYRMTSSCRRPEPLEVGHTEYPEAALNLLATESPETVLDL